MSERSSHHQPFPSPCATRLHLFLLVVLVPIGLSTKSYHGLLQGWVHQYAGDVLYAMFLYLVLRLFWRRASWQCGTFILLFCAAVEFSQLIHTPFLQTLRAHFVGALILGTGFDWLDLPHYAIGILVAIGIEYLIKRRF